MSVNQNYNKNFIVKTDGTWDPSCELQPVPSSRTFSAYIFTQVFRAKIRPKSKSKKKSELNFIIIMILINSSNSIVWRFLRWQDQKIFIIVSPQEHAKNQRKNNEEWVTL